MIELQDLIDRFGESELIDITDKQSVEHINEIVAYRAISDAEAEIESYLKCCGLISRNSRGRLIYLDDQTPPKSLIIKACDIARYYLYDDGTTQIVDARYKQAIDWLKLVMKNPAMLTGQLDADNPNNINSGVCVIANPKPSAWIDD